MSVRGLTTTINLLSVNHNFGANLLIFTKLNFFRYNNPFTYNAALQDVPTLFLYNNASVLGTAINLPDSSIPLPASAVCPPAAR